MAWFGRKKEEKKKFDYSDETKELFAERDAFTAEQRRNCLLYTSDAADE